AWHLDPVRIRARVSSLGGLLCLGSVIALSLARPTDLHEDFLGQNYVSKFARTGIEAIYELLTHGFGRGSARGPTPENQPVDHMQTDRHTSEYYPAAR